MIRGGRAAEPGHAPKTGEGPACYGRPGLHFSTPERSRSALLRPAGNTNPLKPNGSRANRKLKNLVQRFFRISACNVLICNASESLYTKVPLPEVPNESNTLARVCAPHGAVVSWKSGTKQGHIFRRIVRFRGLFVVYFGPIFGLRRRRSASNKRSTSGTLGTLPGAFADRSRRGRKFPGTGSWHRPFLPEEGHKRGGVRPGHRARPYQGPPLLRPGAL